MHRNRWVAVWIGLLLSVGGVAGREAEAAPTSKPGPQVHPGWERALAPAAARRHLRAIFKEVSRLAKAGKVPVVIFDIDDTTVSTQERERRAVMAAGRKLGLRVKSKTELLSGVPPVEAARRKELFYESFLFDHRLLRYDQPQPGAKELLNGLRRAGAKIVHLTSRPPDGGLTARKLVAYGFPVRHAEDLVMQATRQKTAAWKRQRAKALASRPDFVLVAAFDNEPANARALAGVLSPRRVVRVLTVANANARAAPPKGIKIIADLAFK